MNVIEAMWETIQHAEAMRMPITHNADSIPEDARYDHLVQMYEVMRDSESEFRGEKGCRWLGYAQGVLCAFGIATIEDMKVINRRHKDGAHT